MDNATPEEAGRWAAIIPNVSGEVVPKVAEEHDLLSAHYDQITITVRNAGDLSVALLGEITRLNDAQTAQHPGLLNRFDPESVKEGNGPVAFATWNNLIVAAVCASRVWHNDTCVLHVSSLVSDKSAPKIALPMLAALFLGHEHWIGAAAEGVGVARIMPRGLVNIGSSKTLMRLGFYAAEVFEHPVTTRNPQKAIAGSAEADGANLQYLRLKGDAEEMADRSRMALENWSVKFGATKES
ncbi:hypothetical protein [Sulfitobacter pacificus]|uniref:hypothetical protein n=1 Tax=Sulfitobacter pacificus TaxID=1499314 RepID=UPI003109D44C